MGSCFFDAVWSTADVFQPNTHSFCEQLVDYRVTTKLLRRKFHHFDIVLVIPIYARYLCRVQSVKALISTRGEQQLKHTEC
jgi:hypothetical protein